MGIKITHAHVDWLNTSTRLGWRVIDAASPHFRAPNLRSQPPASRIPGHHGPHHSIDVVFQLPLDIRIPRVSASRAVFALITPLLSSLTCAAAPPRSTTVLHLAPVQTPSHISLHRARAALQSPVGGWDGLCGTSGHVIPYGNPTRRLYRGCSACAESSTFTGRCNSCWSWGASVGADASVCCSAFCTSRVWIA